MERSARFPIVIDVIAHVLNFFGDKISTDGLVLATLDLYVCGSPDSGVRTQAVKREPMKM
jgi:hypothetical protein